MTLAVIFSELWLVGSVSPPLIRSVKLGVAIQVLTAGRAVDSASSSSIRSVTLMVSAQVLSPGSAVGFASFPFLALVVSV